MFHAISLRLASLARRVRDYRLAHDHAIAASHGWQVHQVAAGTYRYRDPRFNALISGMPRSGKNARLLRQIDEMATEAGGWDGIHFAPRYGKNSVWPS